MADSPADRFNPPPAVRPGETACDIGARELFQSAPGGEAGGNGPDESSSRSHCKFQSAPGGEAGGKALGTGIAAVREFQSAPGGEAGGKRTWPAPGDRTSSRVSIRPRR